MRLDIWLDLKGVSRADFAQRIDTTVQTLSRLIAGKQNISMVLIDAIVRETEGAVTADDLREVFSEAQRGLAGATPSEAQDSAA